MPEDGLAGPCLLSDVQLLGEHGLPEDTPAARQEFERRLEARRLEPGDEAGLKGPRRGWCLGRREFKQKRLEEMAGQVGEHQQETDLVSPRKHDPEYHWWKGGQSVKQTLAEVRARLEAERPGATAVASVSSEPMGETPGGQGFGKSSVNREGTEIPGRGL